MEISSHPCVKRRPQSEDNEIAHPIAEVGQCNSWNREVLNKSKTGLSLFNSNGISSKLIKQAQKERREHGKDAEDQERAEVVHQMVESVPYHYCQANANIGRPHSWLPILLYRFYSDTIRPAGSVALASRFQ